MLNKFNHDATISWILKAAVGTLAVVTLLVIAVLALSLFLEGIDSQSILGILGPAINTIIGAFVGLLGGLTLNGNGIGTNAAGKISKIDETDQTDPTDELHQKE